MFIFRLYVDLSKVHHYWILVSISSGGWEGGQKVMHKLSTGYSQLVPAIHRLSTTPAKLSTGYSHVDKFGLFCGEAVDN
jgi:hypothetical protein